MMETTRRLNGFEELLAGMSKASCVVAKASRDLTEADHECLRGICDEIYGGLKRRQYLMIPGLRLATVEFSGRSKVSLRLHYNCFGDFKSFTSVSSHETIARWVEELSKEAGLKTKKIMEGKKLTGIELRGN